MAGDARGNDAWWFWHADVGSSAGIAYGDIYNLPTDLGTYDTTVFASILLHLRDPFRAVQQAAAHTANTMVITDVLRPGMDDAQDPVRAGACTPMSGARARPGGTCRRGRSPACSGASGSVGRT
jgi:hypothetical protein